MCMCLRPVQRGSEVKLLKPIAGVLSKQSMESHVSHRRHHLRVTTVTPAQAPKIDEQKFIFSDDQIGCKVVIT